MSIIIIFKLITKLYQMPGLRPFPPLSTPTATQSPQPKNKREKKMAFKVCKTAHDFGVCDTKLNEIKEEVGFLDQQGKS